MKLNESQKIIKYIKESSPYENLAYSLGYKVLDGEDVYIKITQDIEFDSDICKITNDTYGKPEDYDEGYTSGWNRGEDPEYDAEQDAKFERATKAYEDGETFEFVLVKLENGEIVSTGEIIAECYGFEELAANLEHYGAKPIKTKATYSFDEGDEE